MTHASEPAPAAASIVTGPHCCNRKQTAVLKQVLPGFTHKYPARMIQRHFLHCVNEVNNTIQQ